MNETLVLTRRLRPNLVLPAILSSLQRIFLFWHRGFSPPWNWLSLLFLVFLLWMVYRTLTGNFDALSGFLFCSIGENVHNNALPIFACVKIRGDKITTGKLLGERHSLADVRSYRTSQEDLPNHLIQFTFSEKYWPNRFSLIIDKDDADTLSNYLKARDIVAVAAISELVALSV